MLDKKYHVLKRQKPWRDAYYYQKADTLYQMTFVFCQRFLPAHGDRTTDRMVQAARSGKQNIVEGRLPRLPAITRPACLDNSPQSV